MNASLHRRMKRIEVDLLPKPEPAVTVLLEPPPDADAKTIAAYLDKLALAKRSTDKVVVVKFMDDERVEKERIHGVTYVRNEWEAQMVILAGARSERGNTDRLADVLKGLSGNVLGVVEKPPPDVHTSRLRSQAGSERRSEIR